jgi:hypothetical protein
MRINAQLTFAAVTLLSPVLAITPQAAKAQTPAQLEYERQQREYRQQQEQQRQEQQRQQQLMNENARRQQEESSRLNAPIGQAPAPAYQGASPPSASRRQTPPVDVAAAIAAAEWEQIGTSTKGDSAFYAARSTIQRSGDWAKMWEMIDSKTATIIDGKRVFSIRNLWEYDCKGSRRRMLAASAYTGHLGKGTLVGSENFPPPFPWQAVGAGDGYAPHFLKLACDRN